MNALAGGIGFTGEICGALTGCACVLGLYAGRGTPEEEEDPRLNFMLEDLMRWFKAEYGQVYGSIRCQDILADDPDNMLTRCPNIVAGTFQKVKELLVENGFDLAGEAL
jgi:C_GCAxxG_C_C family probable redox protein